MARTGRTGPEAWTETTVLIDHADEETVLSFLAACVEAGAVGAREVGETGNGGEVRDPASEGPRILLVYLPEEIDPGDLSEVIEAETARLRHRRPNLVIRLGGRRRIPRQDWATAWKGTFPPERVSRRFRVIPPWLEDETPGEEIPLVLEPGLAFGTGKHATTRHCLAFLEETADREGGLPPSFLDAGCGSAILSIAARRLGARRVVALDIDPEAVRVARRNLVLNRLEGEILLVNGPPHCCRRPFDLVAANLDAPTLTANLKALRSLVRPGGRLLVSGLLDRHRAEILAAYGETGLQETAEKVDPEEGWTTILFRAPGGRRTS